jgi:tetratricopeptide (TPR) repeat protein
MPFPSKHLWVELQRGLLDLSHGRFDDARVHYRQADRAYSGYWLIDAHLAELLGAQGRFDEAIAAYKKVVACVPKPELHQAIGELYLAADEADQAEPWFERALGAYLASAHDGGVHYCHHLADFYSDVRQDGAEAIKWARRDFELRPNFSTQAALAWALYRAGKFDEALGLIGTALSSGVRDAHLYHQAATIHSAAGATEKGDELLRRAAEINPHYDAFHAHH